MNNDLISREALKERLNEMFDTFEVVLFDDIIATIDNAPTVLHDNYSMGYQDGVRKVLSERPQGEWIDEGQYAEGHSEHAYLCKKCGCQVIENPNMIFENRFCKYCGADMRKGEEE